MRRLLLALLATTIVALLCASTATSSQAAVSQPKRYVALGDSYSAASGVAPADPAAPPECARSTRNYPKVIARSTGASLTDVTCGGAETKDYFESQYDGVPPQLDALSKNTQLVTMTIGGNDNGTFMGAIEKCGTAGTSTAGQGSPCKDQYGDSFANDIQNKTYPALVKALQAVHRKSPSARVAILGYPWILPPTEGCYPTMPVARGDVPYLRGIQALLNQVIAQAAAETGTTYVDFSSVSEGHDACQPIGVRWIEPVVTTTNPVIVHPNALGESEMAKRTMSVLGLG